MRVFIVLLVAGLAVLLWPGCDGRSPLVLSPGSADTLHGPLENYEAEAIAVHLSRELQAPLDLYERIRDDLAWIRGTFGDSISPVKIQYHLPWELGRFTVRVNTTLLQDSSSTTYRVFDSLNQIYGMVETRHMFLNFHSVTFTNRYNPVRLIELYSVVPGFEMMEPSTYCCDYPDMYIQLRSGKSADYFFREAWGDCPSGCIYSRVHYFSGDRGDFQYYGCYPSDSCDTTVTTPEWWERCWTLAKDKHYSITWYPDTVIYWP